MFFTSCRLTPCSRFWSRRRSILPSSARAGAGTRIARWRCYDFRTARKFRHRFNACGRMICWRRCFRTRRMVPESVLEEVGKLDPAAIAQVRAEAWPDVRDADELHDVLHTLVALPEDLLFMWGQPPPAVLSSAARGFFADGMTASSQGGSALSRTAESSCHRICAPAGEWLGSFERLGE